MNQLNVFWINMAAYVYTLYGLFYANWFIIYRFSIILFESVPLVVIDVHDLRLHLFLSREHREIKCLCIIINLKFVCCCQNVCYPLNQFLDINKKLFAFYRWSLIKFEYIVQIQCWLTFIIIFQCQILKMVFYLLINVNFYFEFFI